jgi:hypothetical protein
VDADAAAGTDDEHGVAGTTRASSRHAWYGVAIASVATAASTSLTPSGIGVTLRAGTATYSVMPPSTVTPNSSSFSQRFTRPSLQ